MNTAKRFEPHPAALLLPPMTEQEFADLKADIQKHGQRDGIDIFEGRILDGLNRYRACVELGIEPDCWEVDECPDPVAYVLSKNLVRRHLTISQRAMVAADAEELFAANAKERQREQAKRNSPHADSLKVANLPPIEKSKARDEAAKLCNVSPRSVQNAKAIKTRSPELARAVREGKVTTAAALKDLKPAAEPLSPAEKTKLAEHERTIEENLPTVQAELDKLDECPHGGVHQWGANDCERCHEPRPDPVEEISPQQNESVQISQERECQDIRPVVARVKADIKTIRSVLCTLDSIDDSELKLLLKKARQKLDARGVNLALEAIKRAKNVAGVTA